jgi:hypothetical protein
MKCESAQKQVLLAQSGELSWLGRRTLSRHLGACTACRQFEAALNGITAQIHESGPDPAVSSAAMERIRAAARRESSRSELIHIRPSREPLQVSFRPAFIYAALGILLLTGFWLTIRPTLTQPQVAGQTTIPAIAEDWDAASIETQMETLDDWIDVASTDDDASAGSNDTDDEDVNSVARQLLELEGEQI